MVSVEWGPAQRMLISCTACRWRREWQPRWQADKSHLGLRTYKGGGARGGIRGHGHPLRTSPFSLPLRCGPQREGDGNDKQREWKPSGLELMRRCP